MKRLTVCLWTALFFAMMGCHLDSPHEDEVRLALGYVPSVQFAPYYVAIDEGLFEAAGLRVRLEYVPDSELLKLVADGRYHFAVADGDSVILGRLQGLPIRYVLTQYHRYPIGLIASRRLGIRTISDLKGLTIGIPDFVGSSYIGLKSLLFSEGLHESDFQIEAIGYTQATVLEQGRCDAVVGYLANEPVLLEHRGFPVDVIPVSAVADLVGPGLVTSEKILVDKRELCFRVVAALRRAMKETIEHADRAFETARRFIPELQGEQNLQVQRQILDQAIRLWKTDAPLGWCREDQWRQSQDVLFRSKMIDRKIPVSEFFTNELVEAAIRRTP